MLSDYLTKYTLVEILEINGLSEEEVLEYLVSQELLVLPII